MPLPLYRLEQIAARDQVVLAGSTLAEGRPVAQLDPGSGKTRKAYLWAYRSNDLEPGPKSIVFDYQTSRSGQHARQFLDAWRGSLLVDDYGGYKALFVPNDHIYGLPRFARAFSHLETRNRLQQYIRPVGAPLALAPMTFARQVPISSTAFSALVVIGFSRRRSDLFPSACLLARNLG